MAKERIEERIAGMISLNIDKFDDTKIELINFYTLFENHKQKIPEGTNFSIYFELNSLSLRHYITSLIPADPPVGKITDSQAQTTANLLEFQITHNVDDGFAAELSFYINAGTFPEIIHRGPWLYNQETISYLPLIIPYLATEIPITTNEELIIYCSLLMKRPLALINICQIFGSYNGYITYTFDTGPQAQIFP